MVARILPTVADTDLRPLLYKVPDAHALYDLRRKGICDEPNRIVSQLLFRELIAKVAPRIVFPGKLASGVDGFRQLLQLRLRIWIGHATMCLGAPSKMH